MKTFDEAMEEVSEFLKSVNGVIAWHNNYCRCAEINENKQFEIFRAKLIASYLYQVSYTDKSPIQATQALCDFMLELGISIGQIMEKEPGRENSND